MSRVEALLVVRNGIVKWVSDFRRGFVLAKLFIGYSLVVSTSNYNTLKITVIITHKINSSISALTSRC
jgi:hypothetical protein